MRLLVVSHSCSTSINQQIYAEIQRQTGWQMTLVVPDGWRDEFGNTLQTELWPGFDARLCKVPVWRNGSIIFHIYRKQWRDFLTEFDAIYINHEPYALATAQIVGAKAKHAKIPVGFYSCQNMIKRYPIPFRWMETMVYRKSSFAFPITHDVANVLRAKGFQGRMEVCPLPVDLGLYRPRPKSEWPVEMRRDENEVMLGYVGRIVEAKGLLTLAQALCRLQDLPWKFALIGSGPCEEAFCDVLRQGGVWDRFIKIGFVPHEKTPYYLAALDVLVLPSETQPNWKEQFGRVIPEALACGVAVVGSDSGEIPNLIRQSRGGLVFPEKNAQALADALRELMRNPSSRAEMAAKGQAWVGANVSVEKVGGRMVATMERAVADVRC